MSASRMRDMWPGVHPAVRGLRIAGIAVLGVIGAAVFALVFGWLVMVLWNWLMPAIFHLGEITYWQAFGILILAKLIFGAIGGGRHGRPRHNPWRGDRCKGGHPGDGHDRDDWRYFRRFWDDEGRRTFEEYVQKKRTEEGPGAQTRGQGT